MNIVLDMKSIWLHKGDMYINIYIYIYYLVYYYTIVIQLR